MSTYLQGRKVPLAQDSQRPPAETLRLVRKLLWIGMEQEAKQLQMQMHEATPIGGVITLARETD